MTTSNFSFLNEFSTNFHVENFNCCFASVSMEFQVTLKNQLKLITFLYLVSLVD